MNILLTFCGVLFILLFWDRSSGQSSCCRRDCFVSCCPVSSPSPWRVIWFSMTVTALWPAPCFVLPRTSLNIQLNFLFLPTLPPTTSHQSSGERILCNATTNSPPLHALTAGPQTLLTSVLFDDIFERKTLPKMEVALWVCHNFPFIQITEKPVKWFISTGKLWETWVPLKIIALDSLFKNKVIKLGFFWSLFSSGLSGLSLAEALQF